MAMLEVNNLEVYYGVIRALKGISFEVNEGEIVSLIGANGAGKTTMMQSVVGIIPKRSGSVVFNGQDITKTPCHKIVQLGMTQVPEGRRIFQELTVYENLMMGAYTVKDQQQFKDELESIYQRFPRLAVLCQEPMSRHTTFRTGGPARRMVSPTTAVSSTLMCSASAISSKVGLRPSSASSFSSTLR